MDLTQKRLVLQQFRRPGVCLDDSVILNVLHLLHQLQASMHIHIVDSLIVPALLKQQEGRLCDSLKRLLHKQDSLDVILMPLHRDHHWSLLVFIPVLRGRIHFDSIQGYHRPLLRHVLTLLDNEERYHEMPLHNAHLSQQVSNWECGFFLLMNAFLFIHMKRETLESEETLRDYLDRHSRAICVKNLRHFARKIYSIVSEG